MKNFIVYLPNGKIERVGQCQNEDLSSQGSLVIEGVADVFTQYIKNGVVTNLPPCPGPFYNFDYTQGIWIFDTSACSTNVTAQRDSLLYSSDWTQIPGNPLTPTIQQQWAVYRQALRDITTQPGYPKNVVWPTPPQ